MEVKRDFSYNQCLIINKIKNAIKDQAITKAELAHFIEINQSHKDLRIVLDYFKEIKAVVVEETRGPLILLRFDYKKIKDLLDEQDIINWWVDTYFKEDHVFSW